MALVAFDTLKFMEKLKAAGVPEGEAKAFSEAANEAFSEVLDNTIVTKIDLAQTEIRLQKKMEVEISNIGKEAKADNSRIEKELKMDILKVNSDILKLQGEMKLLKWMMGFVLASIAASILRTFF